jgi:hypothetical protein
MQSERGSKSLLGRNFLRTSGRRLFAKCSIGLLHHLPVHAQSGHARKRWGEAEGFSNKTNSHFNHAPRGAAAIIIPPALQFRLQIACKISPDAYI